MDLAYNELTYTIEQAKTYFANENTEPEILRSHCNDLLEDIASLEKYKTSYGEKINDCLTLIYEAKRLKREAEKSAYSLEIARRSSQADVLVVDATEQPRSFAGAKLPKIKLPIFDGEKSNDYRGFIEAFNETISVEPNLSNVRKWLLLRTYLAGRALELVQELPVTPETFDTATTILKKAYGSSRRAVLNLYQKLQALPSAQMETESLRITNAKIEGILLSLEALDVKVDEEDFLRAVVLNKYPAEIMHTLRITDDTLLHTFRKDVADYIQLRSYTLHSIASVAKQQQPSQPTNGSSNGTKGGATNGSKEKPRHLQSEKKSTGGDTQKSAPPHQVTNSTSNNISKKRSRLHSCIFCSGDHWSDTCPTVATLDERRKKIANRCQKCLREAHPNTDCQKWQCCHHCKETTHNRSICPKLFGEDGKILLFTSPSSSLSKNESSPPQNTASLTKFITAKIPATNAAKTKKAEPRAILDTAGGRCLITKDLVQQLELPITSNRRIRFTGVQNTLLADATTSRKILLHPLRGKPIEIEAYVVDNIVDDIVATDVRQLKQQYPKYADLPMPNEGNGEKIQLLLGYQSLMKMVTLQKSISVENGLQLMGTRFGWIPFGNLPQETIEEQIVTPICSFKEVDPVKLMSDLDTIGLGDFLQSKSDEEIIALEKMYKTIERVGKNYQLEWPYKYDPPELEDNFGVAFGRLTSLYKQLSASPDMLEAYDKIIRDQVESDIVEPVIARKDTAGGKIHYLPHRGIIRIGKSTPIRMVFDASSRRSKNTRSLNENILKGGNWVNQLPGILLRFRRFETAVTSDIARAFHQIYIAPKDRDVTRFLWLRNLSKPPSPENLITYRFKRMAFGIVASPFLLTATIKHHFNNNPNEFADRILTDLYADNLVSSLPKQIDAANFYETTKASFADMGMNITQWVTDNEHLQQKIESSDKAPEENQTVLGIQWDVRNKLLNVKSPNLPVGSLKFTKRVILQETAKVFDPLGWVSPIVLRAKLFIRKVWKLDYTWDQPLQLTLVDEWQEIRRTLYGLHEIKLPRAYAGIGIETATKIELHAFCDASAEAFGMIVYMVVQFGDSSWSGIVAAKTRLTPKSKLSTPRLELLAALTAAKYVRYVHTELQIENCDKYLWGDSKCVLSWITTTKVLPAIVEKSTRTIREIGFEKFLYVPGIENPADESSRGATLEELQQKRWWSGPRWLIDSEKWPQQSVSPEKEEETATETAQEIAEEEEKILLLKQTVKLQEAINPQSLENSPFDLNPDDFPSLGKLLRITALCKKAASRFLRGRGTIQRITELDYEDAKNLWLRWEQTRIYKLAATEKSNVSYLRNLRVRLDDNEIIRCVTRLGSSSLPREQMEPILLAKGTRFTKLLILSTHFNNYHAGTAHTLAALRRQYWLPHGRREVYRIVKKFCHTCRRQDAQPFKAPEMAPLPDFRVTPTETPFQNVGLDVFGPYKVRTTADNQRKTVKCWVLICTCLVVRAVHLELLRDMTAEEFLNAFRKFVSRRGVPKIIVSDNAPQFTVINGIFQCMWRKFATSQVTSRYYAEHQIQWRFIPAHAPWMGGAYERMIKTVKTSFEKVYGGKILDINQFELAIIEIEAVVNSRPITYVDKAENSEIVTPNDFLQLRYPAVPIDFTKSMQKKELTENWSKAQCYLEEFWRFWSDYYLQEIRERREKMPNSRHANPEIPKPGELVLMVDPDQKRSAWRIAVIERTISGEDGKIRSAQIKTANRSRMIRPIVKLASLKLLMDLPEDIPPLNADNTGIVVDEAEGEVEI